MQLAFLGMKNPTENALKKKVYDVVCVCESWVKKFLENVKNIL